MIKGLSWPNCTGFWSSGGQIYYARISTLNGDYEVRDCRNYDTVTYVTYQDFKNRGLSSKLFPWFPCTLSIHKEGETLLDTSMTHDERTKAAELLIEVCKAFDELDTGEAYYELFDLNIDGLSEWWKKHKPKSEREIKLEKIACALSLDGKSNPGFIKLAERILDALES
jgi:hypothetical protein